MVTTATNNANTPKFSGVNSLVITGAVPTDIIWATREPLINTSTFLIKSDLIAFFNATSLKGRYARNAGVGLFMIR